jgi:GNAT superfamily N-acetyltransferase
MLGAVRGAPHVTYSWREAISDNEMVELIESHGGSPVAGWWDQIRHHSLGWVSAQIGDTLVGFVNVAWDGGDHAFLLDTKTRRDHQRRGIATNIVALAVEHARAAGCEWLHVDFRPELRGFYIDACGFQPTEAGLIQLRSTK